MVSGRLFVVRLFGLGVVGGLLTVWCSLGGCCAVERGEANPFLATPATGEYVSAQSSPDATGEVTGVDFASRPLSRIPAGTVIGKTAPPGWSNFLMIAVPTLTEKDAADAPKIATHYA